jgi:hypothetical protein
MERRYIDAENTVTDGPEMTVTEEEVRKKGWKDGGKLLVSGTDKDVFVLLTDDGRLIGLRVD